MTSPPTQQIRVAILGPTGYTGLELIQLILGHPVARLTYLASHRDLLPNIIEEFPRLEGLVPSEVALCRPIDIEAIAEQADVCFVALPHRTAMAHVPHLLKAGLRVVDLSADYRLNSIELYQSTYGHSHSDPENISQAVYGLPELFRTQIPSANLIANPGCYPTAAALSIAPLLANHLIDPNHINISAASGVTGAGRKPSAKLHYPELNEAFGPYGAIGQHRHQPEIEQTLSTIAGSGVHVRFVPHLLPVNRGILETIYLEPKDAGVSAEQIRDIYRHMYEAEPFVRMVDHLPNIAHVTNTNFCDISLHVTHAANQPKITVFAAIDNLIKGAAGQAVQNMNLMFDLDETAGLLPDHPYPVSAALTTN